MARAICSRHPASARKCCPSRCRAIAAPECSSHAAFRENRIARSNLISLVLSVFVVFWVGFQTSQHPVDDSVAKGRNALLFENVPILYETINY